MAMKIIEEDSARHKSELVRLQALSEKEPHNEQHRQDIEKLEILSAVNIPEVRWKFENGYGKDVWTGRWNFLLTKATCRREVETYISIL